jgi:putative hydroxymethylpyrimidine transporter CytX
LKRLISRTTDAPAWGIEPVPDRLRVLGGLDTGLLWGNLAVSLLVLVAGTYLVPALSLPEALLAILVGGLIGNAMLAVAGAIGSDARVPAMVLMRAPLGQRGSYLPTGLNVAQCLGWSIFELLVIATAAAALSDELFGFRAQGVWTVVFGAVALGLALMGPIGFVRRFVRRIAVWSVPLSLGYLTWWAVSDSDLGSLWDRGGEGGMSVWEGADLVVAITVSWIPLAADYTRFTRGRAQAFWGTFVGYALPSLWLLALGAVLFFSRGLSDAAELPAAVVAAGAAAALALFALMVTETDEAFANVYSTAVSLQNLLPRASQRLLVVVVSAAATAGALLLDFRAYEAFLLLLGSFFVPLFAVLLAHWLVSGAAYGERDVFGSPALRPGLVGAWLVGFALYQWLHPTGPAGWVSFVERFDPPAWGVGATVPSFAAAFVLAGALSLAARRGRAASAAA